MHFGARQGSEKQTVSDVGRGNHWYKDAVVYALDVGTYVDSDGDGVGDFVGLTSRLDYLASLGVTCLWLLPFYPTPNRDNGYDIEDYYAIDPRHGTFGDFAEFVRGAKARGLRLIVDLVVNHTSDRHPWFLAARADPRSRYRDYYVWANDPPPTDESTVFPDLERGPWAYDEVAKAYYWHRFYAHQPDLNLAHPAVQEEIRTIIGFWLALGVDGFRVDAAPYMVRPKGPAPGAGHDLFRELRAYLSGRRGDAVFVAEADSEPDELAEFFGGDGQCDEMHLLFNFMLNNYLWLALARGAAEPLSRGLGHLPAMPAGGQWANFVRNLDELDLERLSEEERHAVFEVFAPDTGMRVYGRGIRRRAAPMLGNERRFRLAYSLALTLPGTPVIVYGDEIGMGEDLTLPERESVRTPMQWSSEPNAGFSTAPRHRLPAPVIEDGPFGCGRINVDAQRRDPDSTLNWLRRAIWIRKQIPEFGWGVCRPVETDRPAVFAHRADQEGGTAVAVHNLSGDPCDVGLHFGDEPPDRLVDLFGDRVYEPVAGEPRRIALEGYGFRWFRGGGVRR